MNSKRASKRLTRALERVAASLENLQQLWVGRTSIEIKEEPAASIRGTVIPDNVSNPREQSFKEWVGETPPATTSEQAGKGQDT